MAQLVGNCPTKRKVPVKADNKRQQIKVSQIDFSLPLFLPSLLKIKKILKRKTPDVYELSHLLQLLQIKSYMCKGSHCYVVYTGKKQEII